MNRTRRFGLLAAATLLTGLAGCVVVPMSSHATFNVNLTAEQEVPSVVATGTGNLEARYNKLTRVLSYKLTYAGLSGNPTAAHFHGPARAGSNAGVVVPLANPVTNPTRGEATLTPEQANDLLAGLWYLNVHTAVNPAGEIRGQLVPQ